jgi:hypothetical protein
MTEYAQIRRFLNYVNTKLAELEAAAHRVMDREHEWWPFVFLKPEPEAYLTSVRVAALSCLYAFPAGLISVLMTRAAGDIRDLAQLSSLVAYACAMFFLLYRFTFAYFWNRRAENLQRLNARRTSWQHGQSP